MPLCRCPARPWAIKSPESSADTGVQIRSCWRKLTPDQPTTPVLAHQRKGETLTESGAGFGIGTPTVARYPKLDQALRAARWAGPAFVVLDGTLLPVDDSLGSSRSNSGKQKKQGMNLQIISSLPLTSCGCWCHRPQSA
jgi:hypothetical protein